MRANDSRSWVSWVGIRNGRQCRGPPRSAAVSFHCGNCEAARPLACYFGPTIIVLVDADAFAIRNLVQKPGRNDLSRRVFQSTHFVEQAMIDLAQQRLYK